MAVSKFDAPIPGENMTSDTKNYPWHRPPEHDDLDAAIEDCANKLFDEESVISVTSALEMGITIAEMTQIFLMSGVGKGKWTVDFALLLAGPVSHMLVLMAKSEGIKVDLGIDSGPKPITSAFLKALQEDKNPPKGEEEILAAVQDSQPSAPPSGGFMSPPSAPIRPQNEGAI